MTTGSRNGSAIRADDAAQQPASRARLTTPEDAFGGLLQLVRAIQTGMQNIDPSHGLSGSQLWALWQISAQPGLRVTELAGALHLHASSASNLLDKLESRELVRRERSNADSRVVHLYLADAGIKLVKEIPGPMQGRLRQALQKVPAPVLAGLLTGIGTVLELMGEIPE